MFQPTLEQGRFFFLRKIAWGGWGVVLVLIEKIQLLQINANVNKLQIVFFLLFFLLSELIQPLHKDDCT